MKITNQRIVDKNIAESMAHTNNQAETARQLGIHKSTVSRHVKKDSVKAMIEVEQAKFFESLPNARENIQFLVDNYHILTQKEDKDRAWKSSMEMCRAAGMLPSHSPSVFVQNIYNDHSTTVLNPVIKTLLEGQMKAIADVVEVEFEEVEDGNKEHAAEG